MSRANAGPEERHPTAPPQEGTRPGAVVDITGIVAGARRGEHAAWTTLLERFLPLIRAVARGYRLNEQDVDDVGQTVFLHLLEHLGSIREPRALPGWITTTTRRESLKVVRRHRQTILLDPVDVAISDAAAGDHGDLDSQLLRAEEAQALRDGLEHLPQARRDLLLLLAEDQPLSYREISRLLAMPIGSIGPTRARSLVHLRATPPMRHYLASVEDGQQQRVA
jgi:RNA polymerase sigma factor (sigma-70 family)